MEILIKGANLIVDVDVMEGVLEYLVRDVFQQQRSQVLLCVGRDLKLLVVELAEGGLEFLGLLLLYLFAFLFLLTLPTHYIAIMRNSW